MGALYKNESKHKWPITTQGAKNFQFQPRVLTRIQLRMSLILLGNIFCYIFFICIYTCSYCSNSPQQCSNAILGESHCVMSSFIQNKILNQNLKTILPIVCFKTIRTSVFIFVILIVKRKLLIIHIQFLTYERNTQKISTFKICLRYSINKMFVLDQFSYGTC